VFSLLAICLSGVHAETAAQPSESFGLGTQADLNGWIPGTNPLGLGTQADLNGWEMGNVTE